MSPPKPDSKQQQQRRRRQRRQRRRQRQRQRRQRQQRLGTDRRSIIIFIFCSCSRFAWTTTCLGLVNCLQCTISALIIKLYRCGRKVYADIFMNFIAKVFVLYWRFLRRYVLNCMVCSCADHVETSGVHCYMCTICTYL